MVPVAGKASQKHAVAVRDGCLMEARAVTITVPGEIEFRGLVLSAVAAICGIACPVPSIGREFTNELVSAVGEAFNNAVVHAYKDKRGAVGVSVFFDSIQIVVELTDTGESFDFDAIPVLSGNELKESGFGLYIIKSFTDEFSYAAGSPNRVRMTKHFPSI